VWEGESGAVAADALATCGAGTVAAAYSLDPATGVWSRWFAGQPDVSDLPPFSDLQGVLALGAAAGPTVTPSPTPSPTATPAPGTGDVTLVSSNAFTTFSSIVLIDGESRRLTVVGELRNDSSTSRKADIEIVFYDAANNFLGRRWADAFDEIIRPGRTTAFNEQTPSYFYGSEMNDYPEGWTRYEITLWPADPEEWEVEPVDVAVENVQVTDGGHHVTGYVRNNSSETIPTGGAVVYAIYYRADGTILNAKDDYALNNNPIPPGDTVQFDVQFFDGPVDFSTYVVQAYGEGE